MEVLKDTLTFPLSITAFPRIGCPGFTLPEYPPTTTGSASESLFFPDEAIWSSHPRYKSVFLLHLIASANLDIIIIAGPLLGIFVKEEEKNLQLMCPVSGIKEMSPIKVL